MAALGTTGGDSYEGNDQDNLFVGLGGQDKVNGANGTDIFSYGYLHKPLSGLSPTSSVTFNLINGNAFWDGGGKEAFEKLYKNKTTGFDDYKPANTTFTKPGTLENIESISGGIATNATIGNDVFLAEGIDAKFDATVTITQIGDANQPEIIEISHAGDSGPFSLTFDGVSTSPFKFNQDAQTIQDALNALEYSDGDKLGQSVFTADDQVTVTEVNTGTPNYAWKIEFTQAGTRPQIRMNEGRDNTYLIPQHWGDDLIIDQGGLNELDFSFYTGEITDTVVDALLLRDGTAGSAVITPAKMNGQTQSLVVTASSGGFQLSLNHAVTAPIAYTADAATIKRSLKDALDANTPSDWPTGWGLDVAFVSSSDETTTFEIEFTGFTSQTISTIETTFYDDNWHFITGNDGMDRLTAVGAFTVDLGDHPTVKITSFSKPSDVLSTSSSAGLLAAQPSDEVSLNQGLASFESWVSNIGSSLDDLFTTDLPFLSFNVGGAIGIDGIGDTPAKVAAKVKEQVSDVVAAAFNSVSDGEVVTTQTIVDYANRPGNPFNSIDHATSSNLKEFQASVELASFKDNVDLSFDDSDLGAFGLQSRGSTPIVLEADLDLDFVFGLDEDGHFYVQDPKVSVDLTLDHEEPLDISVTLGPLGLGVEDGTMKFDVGLGFGTDGRIDFDALTGDVRGSLLGAPRLDSDASFNIYLPIELQGALAGLRATRPSLPENLTANLEHPAGCQDSLVPWQAPY